MNFTIYNFTIHQLLYAGPDINSVGPCSVKMLGPSVCYSCNTADSALAKILHVQMYVWRIVFILGFVSYPTISLLLHFSCLSVPNPARFTKCCKLPSGFGQSSADKHILVRSEVKQHFTAQTFT